MAYAGDASDNNSPSDHMLKLQSNGAGIMEQMKGDRADLASLTQQIADQVLHKRDMHIHCVIVAASCRREQRSHQHDHLESTSTAKHSRLAQSITATCTEIRTSESRATAIV